MIGGEARRRDPFKGEDIHVHFPAGGIPKVGLYGNMGEESNRGYLNKTNVYLKNQSWGSTYIYI